MRVSPNPLYNSHYNPNSLGAKIAVFIVLWPIWAVMLFSIIANFK
jgi:hypothetical protein